MRVFISIHINWLGRVDCGDRGRAQCRIVAKDDEAKDDEARDDEASYYIR
jgi:hypothetical protein